MYELPNYITSNHKYFKKFVKKRALRNQLLEEADKKQLLGIVEVCLNILEGNVELTRRQRKRLAHFGDFYRDIVKSRSAKNARHRIQTGGSLGAIAAILSPILGVIAQNILDRTLASKNETR
jgi:hypothetical protein